MKCSRVFKKISMLFGVLILLYSLTAPSGAYANSGKFNMSYIYFGDSSTYVSQVEATRGSLDEISPNYFDISSDGTLALTPAVDADFINEMHEEGIKVVPFLSNHWDQGIGRAALERRQQFAAEVAGAVAEYNLDGVNIDIENLNESDRDNYTDFIRLLKGMLPEGKELAIAVAANPNGVTWGWQGSYDYKSLAVYCDYLMVMAYDEHYQGGAVGPVASGDFVERSVQYAISKAPKEKIVLGIPFYGRYWKNGQSYGGYGVDLTDVDELIWKYGGQVAYDTAAQSPKATITIKSGDVKPYLYGGMLDAGTYTFWYENEESIKYKLELVEKYGLKGTGSWSLGQETSKTWNFYNLWLNGFYFDDAQGSWAQNSILSMALKGWMKGVSSTSFAPESPLTRAETAAIMVRALGLQKKSEDSCFTDTLTHWAKDDIEIARQNGIVFGTGDGKFSPDKPVTREEAAVMLDRALVLPETDGTVKSYTDVTPEKCTWSYDSIMKMTGYGFLYGNVDGRFRPYNNTTRAQMAALMDRISSSDVLDGRFS